MSPLPSHLSRALRCAGLVLSLACAPGAAFATIQFVDVTNAAGIEFTGSYGPVMDDSLINPDDGCGDQDAILMQRNMGNGAAVGDFDRDGDLDVYLAGNHGVANKLYRNDIRGLGTKTFTDVTATAFALADGEQHDVGLSRVAHFVDLDGDRWLDLLVVNDDDISITDPQDPLYGPSRIYQNNGDGSFSEIPYTTSGFRPHGYIHAGVSLVDYDRDGKVDVYVTVWTGFALSEAPTYPGRNELYQNLGDFTFQNVTDSVGLGTFQMDSFAAIFHDFDGDHDAEIFQAVDHTRDYFYEYEEGRFRDVTGSTFTAAHHANDMGIAAADFDNDDDLDLYVTNIFGGFADLRNVLWRNDLEEGSLFFRDIAPAMGVTDTYWGWGTEFIDVENDGDLDLLAVNGFDEYTEYCEEAFGGDPDEIPYYDRPTVLFQNLGGDFERAFGTGIDFRTDDSRALVAFDYDLDGDRDFLVTNVDQPAVLFENQTASPGNWMDVVLTPDHCAIGAIVRLDTGSKTLRRDVIAGRSYLAGTPSEVHFGLGEIEVVESLSIEWPDGSVDDFDAPAINERHAIDCVLPEPGSGLLAAAAIGTLGALRRRKS